MLPSTHNANCPDTVSLPFLSGLTTNSKQDQDLILPFSPLDFPSSPFRLCLEEDSSALLLQPLTGYSLPSAKTDAMEPREQFFDISDLISSKSEHEQGKVVPSKRYLNKDRHSKINTAQGPRDRRMRLSLEVARKFFDLQDMLGYDKASMTVEWLLTQSEPAIEELSKDSGNSYKLTGEMAWESSPSDCDVVSGIIDESVDAFISGDQPEKAKDDSKEFEPQPDLRKAKKTSRSEASTRRFSSSHLARESRDRARARAKERTREKMMSRMLKFNNGSKPFEIGGEWWTGNLGHNMKLPTMGVQAQVEEPRQQQAIREHRVKDPFTIASNYLQSIGIFQENQFRDFQQYPKPWETCNGTSYLC